MPKPETTVIHAADGQPTGVRPLTTPIYQTSTFTFADAAELERYNAGGEGAYLYSRYANPTVEAAERTIAALEGAEAGLLTASGMAATAAVFFGLLSAGDELVTSASIYGGSVRLATDVLARFGVHVRLVPVGDDLTEAIGPRTKLVWFESPTNPTLHCLDIAHIAGICRARGVLSIVDITFAGPINQRPLAAGVDLVMHSATKYLNGHSDLIAGAVVGSTAIVDRLREARKVLGSVLDPGAAYLLTRGLKTLAVRMARQNDTAMQLARWLEADRRVSSVLYPGLASHPDHAVAARQMDGFGGMLTFTVDGGLDACRRIYDRFDLVGRAASLGGVETICSLPVLTSHHGMGSDALAAAGVTDGMLRLSVGLEAVEDLIADLDKALG